MFWIRELSLYVMEGEGTERSKDLLSFEKSRLQKWYTLFVVILNQMQPILEESCFYSNVRSVNSKNDYTNAFNFLSFEK